MPTLFVTSFVLLSFKLWSPVNIFISKQWCLITLVDLRLLSLAQHEFWLRYRQSWDIKHTYLSEADFLHFYLICYVEI